MNRKSHKFKDPIPGRQSIGNANMITFLPQHSRIRSSTTLHISLMKSYWITGEWMQLGNGGITSTLPTLSGSVIGTRSTILPVRLPTAPSQVSRNNLKICYHWDINNDQQYWLPNSEKKYSNHTQEHIPYQGNKSQRTWREHHPARPIRKRAVNRFHSDIKV